MYVNSPGGSVQAGLAIFDTMKYIPCDVKTVCFGMAASMGAFLLSAGTPGKREIATKLKNNDPSAVGWISGRCHRFGDHGKVDSSHKGVPQHLFGLIL